MKKNKKYVLCEKKIREIKVVLNSVSINGYHIKPRNKMEYDGIVVKSMIIVNHGLVEQLLKKKIKKKLDSYLQFLISVLDEDDTDSGHLMFALNDLERYRRTIMNNYRVYLDKKYFKILMNKLDLIDQELRSKIKIDLNQLFTEQMEMDLDVAEKGKSR
jgi:hypothetical protein